VSSTIDSSLTMVMGDDMVKVVAWYDNGEWRRWAPAVLSGARGRWLGSGALAGWRARGCCSPRRPATHSRGAAACALPPAC
jgi:hypothetical protein